MKIDAYVWFSAITLVIRYPAGRTILLNYTTTCWHRRKSGKSVFIRLTPIVGFVYPTDIMKDVFRVFWLNEWKGGCLMSASDHLSFQVIIYQLHFKRNVCLSSELC